MSRPNTVQRANGIPREKICQFKLVLLGKLSLMKLAPGQAVLSSKQVFFVSIVNVDLHLFLIDAHPLPGESAVGKSSLVLRFVKGQFHEYQESTIGGMSQ